MRLRFWTAIPTLVVPVPVECITPPEVGVDRASPDSGRWVLHGPRHGKRDALRAWQELAQRDAQASAGVRWWAP